MPGPLRWLPLGSLGLAEQSVYGSMMVQVTVRGDGSMAMSSWVTESSQPVAAVVSGVVPVFATRDRRGAGLTGAAVAEVDLDVRERWVGERG